MNLLFATEYYPPFLAGGSPTSIHDLGRALVERGHTVTVVTPNHDGQAAAGERLDGVRVVRFPLRSRLDPVTSLVRSRVLTSPVFHWRMARAILAEVRRHGADLIHAQDKHALVGSFVAARLTGRRFFATLRDTGLLCPIATCLLTHEAVPADCGSRKLQRECLPPYLDTYIKGGWLRRLRVRAQMALLYLDARVKAGILRRADGVIALSGALRNLYAESRDLPSGRLHVVQTPVTADAWGGVRLTPMDGCTRVLYVGKLSPGKGGPVFLEAARRISAQRADAIFWVVGPDDPAQRGGTNVRWLGHRRHESMADLYWLADLAVVPSVAPEALSRVPLEAAAAGTPSIGSRAGGIPEEIWHGRTGWLVPRSDAIALADTILAALDDADRLRTMGGEARAFVADRFGPDRVAADLLDAYAQRPT